MLKHLLPFGKHLSTFKLKVFDFCFVFTFLLEDICTLTDVTIEESVIEEEPEILPGHVISTCEGTLDSLEVDYYYSPEYARDIVEYLMVT